jgi:hypothetical protein
MESLEQVREATHAAIRKVTPERSEALPPWSLYVVRPDRRLGFAPRSERRFRGKQPLLRGKKACEIEEAMQAAEPHVGSSALAEGGRMRGTFEFWHNSLA